MSEWIQVEDRLPEYYEIVLVFTRPKIFTLAFRSKVKNREWWDPDRFDLVDVPITHWMPLPDPPKEGS